MEKSIIAPSVLSADFSAVRDAMALVNDSGAEWVHLDVMDGAFVPPISFGPKMVKDMRPHSSLVFDIHLMVQNPQNHFENFAEAGADYITFHIEAVVHAHRALQTIRKLGKKAGISIVPSTPVVLIEELLPFTDLVLVMTVNPGYGGQPIIPECFNKVKTLHRIRLERRLNYLISVDGGINESTAALAREAGVDVMVVGSAFFNASDPGSRVRSLKG
jgi:ribulose-phosphate 3-epimerase